MSVSEGVGRYKLKGKIVFLVLKKSYFVITSLFLVLSHFMGIVNASFVHTYEVSQFLYSTLLCLNLFIYIFIYLFIYFSIHLQV